MVLTKCVEDPAAAAADFQNAHFSQFLLRDPSQAQGLQNRSLPLLVDE
jgi:hypothetical protein